MTLTFSQFKLDLHNKHITAYRVVHRKHTDREFKAFRLIIVFIQYGVGGIQLLYCAMFYLMLVRLTLRHGDT